MWSVRLFRNPTTVADFTVRDLDGRTISLASLRGKVTVVNLGDLVRAVPRGDSGSGRGCRKSTETRCRSSAFRRTKRRRRS